MEARRRRPPERSLLGKRSEEAERSGMPEQPFRHFFAIHAHFLVRGKLEKFAFSVGMKVLLWKRLKTPKFKMLSITNLIFFV